MAPASINDFAIFKQICIRSRARTSCTYNIDNIGRQFPKQICNRHIVWGKVGLIPESLSLWLQSPEKCESLS